MTKPLILAIPVLACALALQPALAQSPGEGGKGELSTEPYRAPETAVPRSLSFWPFVKGGDDQKTCESVEPGDAASASQARDRLAKAGFERPRALHKGCDNVWRGIATQDGRDVQVEVNPQGDVVVQ